MSIPAAVVDRLPSWMRSVRFRITILYSTVLFLLAALLVWTLYFALSTSLREQPVSKAYILSNEQFGDVILSDMRGFERHVNKHTLDNLREFSFAALGVLFVVSLGVGWVISGRVLSPIDRITDVANRIQATDLSRRIELEGPRDELKRLADTFDLMLERLDAAFAQQRRFIADASHELRSPLAIIRTNIDVDLADPDASREKLRQTALVVRRATERMSRLVDDLLALARLERASEVMQEVSLSVVAEEVVEEFAALAAEHGTPISREIRSDATVRADRDAIKRAVANLVDNAIRFSPVGAPVVVGVGWEGTWAWVGVRDEGPGIAPEDCEKVFERFWRADPSRSRERGGSGLGLAIVKQIVESHLGRVRVFSEPGRGSTFVAWLPASAGGARAAEVPPEASPMTPYAAFKSRVMD